MTDPASRGPGAPNPAPPSPLPRPEERERVVQALSAHFANDRLSMEEFEIRLERAYKAVSATELATLVTDLPGVQGGDPGSAAALLAPSSDVPARGVVMAVLGANERRGSWLVPRHLK